MNAESWLINMLDRAIAAISPLSAVRRQHARAILQRSTLYAAAKTTRLTGNWSTLSPNVNDIIGASSPAVRARVRQLVRDFPYFARAVNNMVDYTVGQGIIFQSRVKTAKGKLDKKSIQAIEDAWKWWCDEADTARKLHYYEIMRLMKRQDVEAGEFLLVKSLNKESNRYLPYSLQVYEADWLSSTHDSYNSSGFGIAAAPGEKEIRQGVEYDKETGVVTGYWFCDPSYGGRDVYIRADQVIHGFDMLRPQQLRGISPFAPGVLLAHDLDDYMGAEIDGAKFAAKWVAKVKRSDPATAQMLNGITGNTNTDSIASSVEELENGIIEYVSSGEDIDLMSSNRPGTTFDPFVRLLLTMLSITTGVPYEPLTGDYRGLNFSTAKIVRSDFQQQLRPISARHIRQFGMATFKDFLNWSVLTGRVTLPGYFQNPRRYWESEWQPPGMEAVDPLREAKSQVEAISYGLKSPQEVARERGRDLEDIYREIQDAKEMAKDYGLDFTKPGTSMANNPASIVEE